MDTRSKIVGMDEARVRAKGGTAVIAYCDPLLPAHVGALAGIGEGLTLVIGTPSDAYLPAGARAELAAALAFVQTVVIADGDPLTVAESLEAGAIAELQAVETPVRETFIRYVRERAQS